MRTFYRRQASREVFLTRPNILLAVFVAVLFIIGLVNPSIVKSPFRSFAVSLSLVIHNASNSLKNLFGGFYANEELQTENQKIKKDYQSLYAYCTFSAESLTAKNLELEAALLRNKDISNTVGTAFIIGKPPISLFDTFIIDLGESNSVQSGDLVLVGEFVVGQVSEVLKNRSTVKMFGKKGENKHFLVGDERLPLQGEGQGAATYHSEFVGASSIIGALARLTDYPEFYFGRVVANDMENKYQVAIQSPVNIFEQASVQIIRYKP